MVQLKISERHFFAALVATAKLIDILGPSKFVVLVTVERYPRHAEIFSPRPR
jgi:hypothetical protein